MPAQVRRRWYASITLPARVTAGRPFSQRQSHSRIADACHDFPRSRKQPSYRKRWGCLSWLLMASFAGAEGPFSPCISGVRRRACGASGKDARGRGSTPGRRRKDADSARPARRRRAPHCLGQSASWGSRRTLIGKDPEKADDCTTRSGRNIQGRTGRDSGHRWCPP